jgi:hypothetical protein
VWFFLHTFFVGDNFLLAENVLLLVRIKAYMRGNACIKFWFIRGPLLVADDNSAATDVCTCYAKISGIPIG